jgi:hypothetical protein
MKISSESFFTQLIIYIILFVVAVYITRWIFGIDKIIENQNKTNTLLQNLLDKTAHPHQTQKSTSSDANSGDVNNPNALNDTFDKLK